MDQVKIKLPSDAEASGRSFGAEEIALLTKVIESGRLNSTGGELTKQFQERFKEYLGVDHCRACMSGTAAVHTAIAAVDPEPGDEIISTPITDMGAIVPIIYQTAIPVFADVDPLTYNVTAETIEKKITRRTKAVVVTHLFGQLCDMDPIVELCKKHDLMLIEDCAQAYGATFKGRLAGTFGDVGCYSLQQTKHISAGEGGMIITNDEKLFRRMRLFIDKAWGYGDPKPDHYFLAPNYRMTDLQGAVALAQLDKLPANVNTRIARADQLAQRLADIDGVHAPHIIDEATHTYWKYPLRVDGSKIDGGAVNFGAKMKEAGVWCAPRYIQKPAFECAVLKDRVTFGKSEFPFKGEHRKDDPPVIYDRAETPGTIEALENVVVLPWNERYTEEHVDHIANTIAKVAGDLRN